MSYSYCQFVLVLVIVIEKVGKARLFTNYLVHTRWAFDYDYDYEHEHEHEHDGAAFV